MSEEVMGHTPRENSIQEKRMIGNSRDCREIKKDEDLRKGH